MKKSLVCFIVLILCLGFCSCGSSNVNENQENSKTTYTEAEIEEEATTGLAFFLSQDEDLKKKANLSNIPMYVESVVKDGDKWKVTGKYLLYQRYNEGAHFYDGPFSVVLDVYGEIVDVEY